MSDLGQNNKSAPAKEEIKNSLERIRKIRTDFYRDLQGLKNEKQEIVGKILAQISDAKAEKVLKELRNLK